MRDDEFRNFIEEEIKRSRERIKDALLSKDTEPQRTNKIVELTKQFLDLNKFKKEYFQD